MESVFHSDRTFTKKSNVLAALLMFFFDIPLNPVGIQIFSYGSCTPGVSAAHNVTDPPNLRRQAMDEKFDALRVPRSRVIHWSTLAGRRDE